MSSAHRRVLHGILATFVLLAVTYSVSVPIFETPDELFHYPMVEHLATEHALPTLPTEPGGEAGALESWARLVFPLGLIIIIQTTIGLGLIGWPGSFTLGLWWLPLISSILAAAAFFLSRWLGISPPYLQLPASSRLTQVLEWATPRLENIFRLEWLYRALWSIYTFLGRVLQVFSQTLEGEGGILWTALMLLLLIAALARGANF